MSDLEDLFFFGRCRSGKRWFWAVANFGHVLEEHGWEDTEQQALAVARRTVERLGNGKRFTTLLRHGFASRKLAEINTAKRAARPPSDAKGSKAVEYLYGYAHGQPVRFRIAKKTAKRLFYIRRYEDLDINGEPTGEVGPLEDAETIGFIDRGKLEETGQVHNDRLRWTMADSRLYASFKAGWWWRHAHPEQTMELDLRELKAAMADAHPDRGGTSAAFIAARRRYVEAKRAQRAVK
jgi:hypothetical protein